MDWTNSKRKELSEERGIRTALACFTSLDEALRFWIILELEEYLGELEDA